ITDIGTSIKSRKKSGFENRQEKSELLGTIRSIDIKQRSGEELRRKSVVSDASAANSKKKQNIKLGIGSGIFRKEKLPEKFDEKDLLEIEEASGAGKKVAHWADSDRDESINEYKNVNLSRKSWKLFLIFGFVAVLAVLLSAAYLFLPKARVTIFPKTKITSMDLDIKADANYDSVNLAEKIIPSRLISVSSEVSENFSATGSGSSNKARGMITVYNEYSSANQPLVVTTRFLSEDGKLFRLVNSISVPGVTTSGSESKPGAIEAEVVADEAGEEFNIGPAKFSIPGFQSSGSEKYAKIYAKSFKSMAGGGRSGGEVKTITDADISSAKSQALSAINSNVKEKLKMESGDGYVILDEAINFGDPVYKISNSSGDTADNFTVDLKLDAKAVVFKKDDIKKVLENIIGNSAGEGKVVVVDSITQEFGKAEADFTKSSLKIKIHAGGKIVPVLDLDEIKKGILGKNTAELEAYFKPYSDITRVGVEYWPVFISGRIPQYGSRVEIELDNN
ncbi:MAG TPA: hypothetical protein VF390_02300, partial [Patescibacteria group bacterium]